MVAFTPNLQDVTLLSDAIKYITDELTNAFKCNQLQSVLKKYHYPVIEKTVEPYFDASLPNGKILVLGSSSCSVRHLEATFKALGLADRLEYCLDYNTLKNISLSIYVITTTIDLLLLVRCHILLWERIIIAVLLLEWNHLMNFLRSLEQ